MNKKIQLLIWVLCCMCMVGCSTEENTQSVEQTAEIQAQVSTQREELTLSMRVPETLNPLMNRDTSVDRILKLIFLPLIGQSDDGKLIQGVAESWTLSEDGKTLSVTLRSGLQWQDGTPVTADDVVFSFQTILQSPEDAVYKPVTNYVASCTKTGEKTVAINFHSSFSGNTSALYFPIIPQSYYKGNTAIDSTASMNPLGNGPYRMESYTLSSALHLIANEQYIDGVPELSKIQVKITSGTDTDVFSFHQGILDALVTDATQAGQYLTGDAKIESYTFCSGLYDFLGFNFKNELFQETYLRQAIAYAVPKQDIYESAYLQYADMTNTPLYPNLWLYEQNVMTYDYNLEMAQTLLKNAGWSDTDNNGILERTKEDGTQQTLSCTILVNQENHVRCQIAAKMEEELESIGFDITVNQQPYETYSESFMNGEFDLVVGGWRMSEVLDLTPFFSTSGVYNYGAYSNEEIDALLTQAYTAVGDAQTLLAYSELQKRLSEELPYISIAYRQDVLMVTEDIQEGISPTRIDVYHNIVNWNKL